MKPVLALLSIALIVHATPTAQIQGTAGPASTSGRSPSADLLVSVRAGGVVAPDSIAPGWTRMRVEEDGAGHILVAFRLRETMSEADLKTFLSVLDTAIATPRSALALGGPEVGDTGEVIVELTPGSYLLACVRAAQGHRHATTGEAKILRVTKARVAASRRTPPKSSQQIGMTEFAYLGTEKWKAGAHMLRAENKGKQDHQVRLARLRDGVTLKDWLNAANPNALGPTITGVARMGPGAIAYLPVDLTPGNYVAYCLVTDPGTKRQHVMMGMARAITVE